MRLYELQLFEGLTYSVDKEKLKSVLQKNVADIKFNTWAIQGYEQHIAIILNKKEHRHFQSILGNLGWFEAKVYPYAPKPGYIVSKIEPKYDKTVDVPDKLYHVTPTIYLDKIRKIGLSPRTQNKASIHPERVYLALNKNSAVYIAHRFSKGDGMEDPGNKKSYALLEIDTRSLKNIKFHNDINFHMEGVYTTQNIPPSAISSNIVNINS